MTLDALTLGAYRAARREQVSTARAPNWRGWISDSDRGAAHRALRLAHDRVADFIDAERQRVEARAALAAVVDKRRYAPAMVAARAAMERAERQRCTTFRRVHGGPIWRRELVRAGHDEPGTVYFERPGETLRYVGAAHDIDKTIRHTGWYLDPDCDETTHGVVYQLPARRGIPRYLAGYSDAHNEGAALLSLDIHDDKEDAARAADRMAESMAEAEREYQEAWRAGQAHRDARRELLAQGRALVAAARDLRDAFRRRHEDARDARALDGASLACFGMDAAALAADARERGVAARALILARAARVRDMREDYRDARRDIRRADIPPHRWRAAHFNGANYGAFWEGYRCF